MKNNKFKPFIITTLMLVLLATSYVAIASDYGSKDDPLVSLSYIEKVLTPEVLDDAEQIVSDKTKEYTKTLDDKINKYSDELETKINNTDFVDKVSEKLSNQSDTKVISLKKGGILSLTVGSEMIVRSGSGVLSSGFVNSTIGSASAAGEVSKLNNLYLSAESTAIFTASADTEILVLGTYSID